MKSVRLLLSVLLFSFSCQSGAAVNYLLIKFDLARNMTVSIASACGLLNGNIGNGANVNTYWYHAYGLSDANWGLSINGGNYYAFGGVYPSGPASYPNVCVAGVPSQMVLTPSPLNAIITGSQCNNLPYTPTTTISLGGAAATIKGCSYTAYNKIGYKVTLPDGFTVVFIDDVVNNTRTAGAFLQGSQNTMFDWMGNYTACTAGTQAPGGGAGEILCTGTYSNAQRAVGNYKSYEVFGYTFGY